jgi:hypothetical protein
MKLPVFITATSLIIAMLLGPDMAGSGQEALWDELILDIDKNGIPDKIRKEKYKTLTLRPGEDRTSCKRSAVEFVRYSLYRDSKEPPKVIFEHPAMRWAERLTPHGDLNGDGVMDFLYRAEDDTSVEYVLVLQKTSSFKAVYIGAFGLSLVDGYWFHEPDEIVERKFHWNADAERLETRDRLVAKWNPKREVFHGADISWITHDCVELHALADDESKTIGLLFMSAKVRLEEGISKGLKGNEWARVSTGSLSGWVKKRYVSESSPTKPFK